jgi:predicted transcriptional regulator
MEVTISLPDTIFANLSSVASKSHRRVDEIIAEKIEREFSIDAEDLGN